MQSPGNDYTDVQAAMTRLKQAMVRSREQLWSGLRLTRTQLELLMLLSIKPGYTTKELAACLSLTQSAVTQTVDTLVRRQFVVRQPDETDRRLIRLHLTEAGNTITTRVSAAKRRSLEKLVARLSPSELKGMLVAINQLSELIEDDARTKLEERK